MTLTPLTQPASAALSLPTPLGGELVQPVIRPGKDFDFGQPPPTCRAWPSPSAATPIWE